MNIQRSRRRERSSAGGDRRRKVLLLAVEEWRLQLSVRNHFLCVCVSSSETVRGQRWRLRNKQMELTLSFFSFPSLPCILFPFLISFVSYLLPSSFLPNVIPYFLPLSLILSFLPSFSPSSLPTYLPSFLLSFPPTFFPLFSSFLPFCSPPPSLPPSFTKLFSSQFPCLNTWGEGWSLTLTTFLNQRSRRL